MELSSLRQAAKARVARHAARLRRCSGKCPLLGVVACLACASVVAQLGSGFAFAVAAWIAPPSPGHASLRQRSRVGTQAAVEEAAVGVVDAEEVDPSGTAAQPSLDGAAIGKTKRALFRLAAISNRGLGASTEEQRRVVSLVEELEASYKPPADLAERRMALEGPWAVAFTTSPDLTSLDRVPLPGWRTGRIGQTFGPADQRREDATNEITFVSAIGSRVNQTVQCTWDLVTDGAADAFKVCLTFVGSSTKLAMLAGLPAPPLPPLGLPLPPAAGTFEVSFLDDELLVQRTRAGASGINVLIRDG